eukprot:11868210-Alexandrium_andersonii.AAC.1
MRRQYHRPRLHWMTLPREWRLCAVVAPVPVRARFELLPAPEPPAVAALAARRERQRLRPAGKGGASSGEDCFKMQWESGGLRQRL